MNSPASQRQSYRTIIAFCLESYARLRANIARQQVTTAREIDYELFLLVYLTMQLDGHTRDHEELLVQTFNDYMGWSPDKVEGYRDRADRQASFHFTDFVLTRSYPELSVIAYKLAYAMTRIDGEVHEEERAFLANLKRHLFAYSFSGGADAAEIELDNVLASTGIEVTSVESATQVPDTPTGSDGKKSSELETGSAMRGSESTSKVVDPVPEQTLESCLEELHRLIGLEPVKAEVERLVRFLQIQEQRRVMGLPVQRVSLHMVFTGNPGTGKTTLGRLLSRIFKAMNILSSGHLVETDRSGLVGAYVGHTAPKTLEVAQKALDGILFVDEAYALARDSEGDFGMESIDTLVKYMEDQRDRLVVIVAGYSQEMKQFIGSNPGLRSRFSTTIHFPDFSADELVRMFRGRCEKNGYELTEASEAVLRAHLEAEVAAEIKGFGNGRYVRNLFEKSLKNQAFRLLSDERSLSRENLVQLLPEDISPNA